MSKAKRFNEIPKIIQWWVTPKLPREHIFIPQDKRPKELKEKIRVYLRKWLIHPIKRRIAKYYVLILQKFFRLTVIGITGSAGKTSTKNMVVSILKQKGKTVGSYKNIDPVYNIPTTILKCRPKTRYLVLEMGVEFQGEMDFYLWLVKPNIGVITNIYPTHTEFFINTKGVFKEKVKLAKELFTDGLIILNKENLQLRKFGKKENKKIIWFGEGSNIRASKINLDKKGETRYTLLLGTERINIRLPILGKQFVSNSLAAVTVGKVCNVSISEIKRGLENFKQPEHRMRAILLKSGALILDDSYNNNPAAFKEAFKTFKEVSKGKRIVVVGDMLELGREEKKYHEEIGKVISESKVDYIIGVGAASQYLVEEASKEMAKNNCFWVQSAKEVFPLLQPLLKKGTTVLIKGSRSIGLDQLVSRLS
jgi:UDP-N-acetylmuramoyl-tripeptide--D-alanyl-D-alanine ligase